MDLRPERVAAISAAPLSPIASSCVVRMSTVFELSSLASFLLGLADMPLYFLFLVFPTCVVTSTTSVFSLPLWSGDDLADKAVRLVSDVSTEFAVRGDKAVEVVVAPFGGSSIVKVFTEY